MSALGKHGSQRMPGLLRQLANELSGMQRPPFRFGRVDHMREGDKLLISFKSSVGIAFGDRSLSRLPAHLVIAGSRRTHGDARMLLRLFQHREIRPRPLELLQMSLQVFELPQQRLP